MPMGFQEVLENPVSIHPVATDALTGKGVDLHPHIHDQASLQAALRASAAMPLLAGEPVEIDGRRYVDAGVSEGTPIRTALAQGATHVVPLRTRRMDEVPAAPSRAERLVTTRWFLRHDPARSIRGCGGSRSAPRRSGCWLNTQPRSSSDPRPATSPSPAPNAARSHSKQQ